MLPVSRRTVAGGLAGEDHTRVSAAVSREECRTAGLG